MDGNIENIEVLAKTKKVKINNLLITIKEPHLKFLLEDKSLIDYLKFTDIKEGDYNRVNMSMLRKLANMIDTLGFEDDKKEEGEQEEKKP